MSKTQFTLLLRMLVKMGYTRGIAYEALRAPLWSEKQELLFRRMGVDLVWIEVVITTLLDHGYMLD